MDTKRPFIDEDSDTCSSIIVVDDEDTDITLQTDQNSINNVQDATEASQKSLNTKVNIESGYNDDGNAATSSAALINTDCIMDTKRPSFDEDSDTCSSIIVVDDEDTDVTLQTDQNSVNNVQDETEARQKFLDTKVNNESGYNDDGNEATSSAALIDTDCIMNTKRPSFDEDSDTCSFIIVVDDEDTDVTLQTDQNTVNNVQDETEARQRSLNTKVNNELGYNDDGNDATSSAALIDTDCIMNTKRPSFDEDSDTCSFINVVDDEDTDVTLQTHQNTVNNVQDETEARQKSLDTKVNNESVYNDVGTEATASAALINTDCIMDTKRPSFDEGSDTCSAINVVDDEDTDVTLQTDQNTVNRVHDDATSTAALINSDCSWSSLENLTDDMGETDSEIEIDSLEPNTAEKFNVDQRKSEERTYFPSCSKDNNLKHANSKTGTGLKCKRYSCKICQYSTCMKQDFGRHIKTFHKVEKSYSCVVCPFKTTRKSTFREHVYSHTRVQPYVCGICDRTFSRKSYIKRHMDKHARDKA